MIEIDGSLHEGGGQILRTAIGLSAVTGKPVRIYNIRAKRKKPGLKTQHMQGIKAVAELCSGKISGAELGSQEVVFEPGKSLKDRITVNIETAGSTGLVFQSLKLLAAVAENPIIVDIKGGATFGKFAPPLIYTREVLLPVMNKMGSKSEINILRHGFYPVGGSRVQIKINPHFSLTPLNMSNRGNLVTLQGVSVASSHLKPARVAERQADAAGKLLEGKGYRPEIKSQYADSDCPGSGIVLWAKTSTGCILGSDGLGERGKPAEKVGKEAASSLIRALESGACLDTHLSDQIIPFLALTKGRSVFTAPELTPHAKTNMWVVEKFLKTSYKTTHNPGNVTIECSGLPE